MGAGSSLSLLRLLVGAGADEAIEELPLNRYVHKVSKEQIRRPDPRVLATSRENTSSVASGVAKDKEFLASSPRTIETLEELRMSVEAFDGCQLKRTATNTVFADGNPKADLMLIGEAPGAEEDRKGIPFVGKAGHLLDRMLAAIDRDSGSAYITNVLFWRPPGNRNPTAEEIDVCLPFVKRHIALVQPRVLVLVGAVAAKSLLDLTEGISRIRGKWYSYDLGGVDTPIDTTAIFHPAFLLRQGNKKRETWQDLIAIRTRLSSHQERG